MAKKRWVRGLLRAVLWLGVAFALTYSLLLAWVWIGRTEIVINSDALNERRVITVFGSNPSVTIYSLDGDKYRHGLIPAVNGALIAWLSGEPGPLFVAIHDHGDRDRDFRPTEVHPALWRPNISGRAAAFDVFLINELRGGIEPRFGAPEKRYLFGHSLGGFYALDMPTRQSQHGFAGLFAFSPTFSHDVSLINRLKKSCATTPRIYANIGLESARDTRVFAMAERMTRAVPACSKNLRFRYHPGMVHQIVMITGQVEAFWDIYSNADT